MAHGNGKYHVYINNNYALAIVEKRKGICTLPYLFGLCQEIYIIYCKVLSCAVTSFNSNAHYPDEDTIRNSPARADHLDWLASTTRCTCLI